MKPDHFHPQFRLVLLAFQRVAPTYLLKWDDERARAQSSDRRIALTESLAFNASVGRAVDGFAAYTVTAGAVAALFDLARTLCATERFVGELPITGKAVETRTIRDPSHFMDYSELIGSRGEPLPPIPLREILDDAVRESLAGLFLDLLFRFLLLHEQMHFVRGHLHFLYGANSPKAFEEIPPSRAGKVVDEDRKALELDADGSALSFILDMFEGGQHRRIIGPYTSGKHAAAGPVAALFDDGWGWSRLVGLASLTVMMLLSLGDRPNQTHPAVHTRMLNLLVTHEAHLRRKFDFTAMGGPHVSVFQFFRDVATVSMTLRTPPPESEVFIEWKTADPSQYIHPACIELRDLYARLEKLLPKLR